MWNINRSAGLNSWKATKLLQWNVNKQKRLLRPKKKCFIKLTSKEKQNEVWTDESNFELFCSQKILSKKKTRMIVWYRKLSMIEGMLGCEIVLGEREDWRLIRVKGIMKKNKQYHSFLQKYAIPSLLRMIKKKITFPETTIQNCLYNHFKINLRKREIMTWPLQSQDSSPIELTREELNWRVQRECSMNRSALFQRFE